MAVSALIVGTIGGDVKVVSNITIALDSWSGVGVSDNLDVHTIGEVIWTLDSMANNVAVYKPSGVVRAPIADVGRCSFAFDPPSHAIDLTAAGPYTTEGHLTVDFNASPPTYRGYGFTYWAAKMTSSCGPPVPSIGGGPWFGGSGDPFGREATGVVTANGAQIDGSSTDTQNPPAKYTWSFTRQQP